MKNGLIDRNTLVLLRIPFSLYLMPVFLLCLSQANSIDVFSTVCSFLIIHLMVYPASNGYNSFIDQDKSSIGGLQNPPEPTLRLYYTTLLLDCLAVLLGLFLVDYRFGLCLLIYILVSRAYSSRQIRLKKYPVAGFLTVMLFQGAFTYYMASIGIQKAPLEPTLPNLFILLACSLQIAGAYPLTQIYQHNEDVQNGDISLSYLLGYNGTFIFTGIMFAFCNVFYYLYFSAIGQPNLFLYLQLFFLPLVIYFMYWFYKVSKDRQQANYKNTMRMNLISSACTSFCFILFIFLK